MKSTKQIVYNFFHLLNFEVSKKYISRFYTENPAPNSLVFFIELFKSLFIKTIAVKADSDNINHFPTPFIIQLDSGKFGIIKEIHNDSIIFSDVKGEK